MMTARFVVLSLALCVARGVRGSDGSFSSAMLSFNEIRSLATADHHDGVTWTRLNHLLSTPLVGSATTSAPTRKKREIRVAFWNIERGREWPTIRMALSSPEKFRGMVERRRRLPNRHWLR